MVDVLALYNLYYFTGNEILSTIAILISLWPSLYMTVSSDDIHDGSTLLINGTLVFSQLYPLNMKRHVATWINILRPNGVAFQNDRVQANWQIYITAKIKELNLLVNTYAR